MHISSASAARRRPSLFTLVLAVFLAAHASAFQDTKKRAAKTFEDYQIAAGTYLPIELRTRLSSNSNRPADPVDARLLRPVTAPDGVELIPAGSLVLGTIDEVEAAGKRKRGRLTFSFHVIEHPETGSRAMIRTAVLEFASERPKKGNVFPEIRLEKGIDVTVALLAPLTVRIPVQPAARQPLGR